MGYIRRHPIISIIILLFITLQLLPLTFDNTQEADPVTRAVMRLNYYPYKAYNYVKSGISETWHNYVVLKDYKKANEELLEENKRLRTEIFRLYEIKLQNRRLKDLLGFTEEEPYDTVPAKVIAGSPSLLRPEFVTIDKGKKNGISEGMPVVVRNGVVGRVYMVDKLSSQVMLITDPISAVDAVVQRTRARGIVKGKGNNCILKYIEREEDIRKGDRIITSGKDGFYPKGIMVGKVESIKNEGGMYNAVIAPEVNIDSLEEVLVIINPDVKPDETPDEIEPRVDE